jgi:hypothetical protein
MQHTFIQKLFLVLLAAAAVAAAYVYLYEDFILSAQRSVNSTPLPKNTPADTSR